MSEERVASEVVYEMLWDCEFCDTKGLLAKSQRHCPECGGKQNADKRYFPPEGQAVRVDGHKYEGSDRYCPSCNAPQSAKAHNCTNCGAPQTGGQEVKGVATPVAPAPKKSRLWILFVVLGVLAIVGIVLGVRHCNRTESAKVTVVAHRWEASIGVEEYKDVEKHDWKKDVPTAERGRMTCRKKENPDIKVPDGQTCRDEKVDNKDGTFKVVTKCKDKFKAGEDDWCDYTVKEWVETKRVASKGTGMNVAFPTQGVPAPSTYERPGKKKVTYLLDMNHPDKAIGNKTCDVSEAAWKRLADKQSINVEVRARDKEIVCDEGDLH
jgi:hypothetical protein